MTDEGERQTPGGQARAAISGTRASMGRAGGNGASPNGASPNRAGHDAIPEDWSGVAADLPLHPIAEALRKTFDADNHATLGRDVTGLMLDLSRVPFEPHEFEPVTPQLQPPRETRSPQPQGWLARARLAMQWMRSVRS